MYEAQSDTTLQAWASIWAARKEACKKLEAVALSVRLVTEEPLLAVMLQRNHVACSRVPDKTCQITALAAWLQHVQVPFFLLSPASAGSSCCLIVLLDDMLKAAGLLT